MKTCPKCGELLGDSIKVCFKCRYDFNYNRVISRTEFAEQREKQIQQQNKQIEEAKLREDQKKIQLTKNSLFEYQVITVDDLSTGQADKGGIQNVLNEWSRKGWRLHSIFTNEIGKTSTGASFAGFGSSINATICQTILVFERCIKE
ncbi:MAG: DUF4177 domain-containing protein [Lachnospiraceae bacterium]|nr:DUF4177 domain-containing protein [Lachnospiraceae bacterium]